MEQHGLATPAPDAPAVAQLFATLAAAQPSGERVSRVYTVPSGKLQALTTLLSRDDVPVLVVPRDDALEVQATESQHTALRAFVGLLTPAERVQTFHLSPEKQQALTALLSRADVPMMVEPGDQALTVRGTEPELATLQAFVSTIEPSVIDMEVALTEAASPEAQPNCTGAGPCTAGPVSGLDGQIQQLQAQVQRLRELAQTMGERAQVMSQRADQASDAADQLEDGDAKERAAARAEALQNQAQQIEEAADNIQEQADALSEQADQLREQMQELMEAVTTQTEQATEQMTTTETPEPAAATVEAGEAVPAATPAPDNH
jgi:hypothetical protein